MSEITKPENYDLIYPTLNKMEQSEFDRRYEAMNRVAAKYPDMNTQQYTEYLTDYLTTAAEFHVDTSRGDSAPVDPRYVRQKMREAEEKLTLDFDKKYPIFAHADASPEEKARAKENDLARSRLSEELNPSILTSAAKMVYDEDNGGVQWSKIAGGGIGLAAGVLMGSVISGAAGGGWLGTIAMIIMGISGWLFGSQMGEYFAGPSESDKARQAAEKAGKEKTMERSIEESLQEHNVKIDGVLKRAEERFNVDGKVTKEEEKVREELKATADITKERMKNSAGAIVPAAAAEYEKLLGAFNEDKKITEEEEASIKLFNKHLKQIQGGMLDMASSGDATKRKADAMSAAIDEKLVQAEAEFRGGKDEMTKENKTSYDALKGMTDIMKTALADEEKIVDDIRSKRKDIKAEFAKDGFTDDEKEALRIYNESLKEMTHAITAPPATPVAARPPEAPGAKR